MHNHLLIILFILIFVYCKLDLKMSNEILNNIVNATTKCTKHLTKLAEVQSSDNHDHSLMNSHSRHGQHNLHDGMIVNRFYNL